MYITAQIMMTIGFVGIMLSNWFKTRKQILIISIIAFSFMVAHYFFMKAYSGAVTNLICTVATLVFYFKYKNKFISSIWSLLLFSAGIVVATVIFWGGYMSIISLFGGIAIILAMWQINAMKIRMLNFVGVCIWLVYNILIFSIAGIVAEAILALSNAVALIYFIVKNRARTLPPEKNDKRE